MRKNSRHTHGTESGTLQICNIIRELADIGRTGMGFRIAAATGTSIYRFGKYGSDRMLMPLQPGKK